MKPSTKAAQHTPGPWTADDSGSYITGPKGWNGSGDWSDNNDNSICHLDDGEYIIYKDEVERLANAELIASAPRLKADRDVLLEAAKAVVNYEGSPAMAVAKLSAAVDQAEAK